MTFGHFLQFWNIPAPCIQALVLLHTLNRHLKYNAFFNLILCKSNTNFPFYLLKLALDFKTLNRCFHFHFSKKFSILFLTLTSVSSFYSFNLDLCIKFSSFWPWPDYQIFIFLTLTCYVLDVMTLTQVCLLNYHHIS